MLHVHDYKNVRPILLSASVFFCLVPQTYTLLLSNNNMHLSTHLNCLRPRYQLPLLACISPLPFLRTETVDLFNSSVKLNDVKKSAPTARTQSPGCRRWRFPTRTDDINHNGNKYPPSRPPSPNIFIFSWNMFLYAFIYIKKHNGSNCCCARGSRLHPQIKNTTIQIVARGFAGTICVLTRR